MAEKYKLTSLLENAKHIEKHELSEQTLEIDPYLHSMHALPKLRYDKASKEYLSMAMLTIRNLDDEVKRRLRRRAAKHGCSMEEEARQILRQALSGKTPEKGLASRIHQRVMDTTGGLELELPARSQPRPAPDFSGGSA